MTGYKGPRCELCNQSSVYAEYFDKLSARCQSCGDVYAMAGVMFITMVLVMALISGGHVLASRMEECKYVRTMIPKVRRIWRRSGMRYKLKVMVGLYQCIAAVPSVFDVTTPPVLEGYSRCASTWTWRA
eukprot:7260770-Prymnesium_polylepis.3